MQVVPIQNWLRLHRLIQNVRDHLAKCQSVEEQAESFPPTSATLLGGWPLPGATRPNPQPTLEKLARDDADQTTSRLT